MYNETGGPERTPVPGTTVKHLSPIKTLVPVMPDDRERERALGAFLRHTGIRIEEGSAVSLARYDTALTHRSYAGYDASYERLEFLGDRVLGLIVAEHLFSAEPPLPEGEMTRAMEFLKNENLGAWIRQSGFFPEGIIRLGAGTPLTPGILADVFEAFTGALYCDRGLDAAKTIVLGLLGGEIDAFDPSGNFKGRLQEYCQQQGSGMPVYQVIARAGPDHAPRFSIRVLVDGRMAGEGTGRTKTEAEQEAARRALAAFGMSADKDQKGS
jgi:ribonuclease-3